MVEPEPEIWIQVSSEVSDLCEISDLLLFVSYFFSQSASQGKGIRFGVFLMCVV